MMPFPAKRSLRSPRLLEIMTPGSQLSFIKKDPFFRTNFNILFYFFKKCYLNNEL